MREGCRLLQAVLFVRGEMVPWKELEQILSLSAEEVREAAQELLVDLAGSALTIIVSEQGVELVTAPEVAMLVASLEEEPTAELSKAGAETLAVVAYRGPLSRQEVSLIRGVESRPMLRQLQRRSLVMQLRGKAGVMLYDISAEALKQLGVRDRAELPDFALLSSDERLQAFLQETER